MRAQPWWNSTAFPRFASEVNEECDHPEHGWECSCLVEAAAADEEMEQLEEELEMAEDAVEEAEDDLRSAEGRVDRLREKLAALKKQRSPAPGQVAA